MLSHVGERNNPAQAHARPCRALLLPAEAPPLNPRSSDGTCSLNSGGSRFCRRHSLSCLHSCLCPVCQCPSWHSSQQSAWAHPKEQHQVARLLHRRGYSSDHLRRTVGHSAAPAQLERERVVVGVLQPAAPVALPHLCL